MSSFLLLGGNERELGNLRKDTCHFQGKLYLYIHLKCIRVGLGSELALASLSIAYMYQVDSYHPPCQKMTGVY